MLGENRDRRYASVDDAPSSTPLLNSKRYAPGRRCRTRPGRSKREFHPADPPSPGGRTDPRRSRATRAWSRRRPRSAPRETSPTRSNPGPIASLGRLPLNCSRKSATSTWRVRLRGVSFVRTHVTIFRNRSGPTRPIRLLPYDLVPPPPSLRRRGCRIEPAFDRRPRRHVGCTPARVPLSCPSRCPATVARRSFRERACSNSRRSWNRTIRPRRPNGRSRDVS
mmetsp:Transcript_31063/g.66115  ORF Transcript_31063/g.66115 Transcript_31063/m.66115 type:complete len:223 (+) Transcript_31063:226-894(+)